MNPSVCMPRPLRPTQLLAAAASCGLQDVIGPEPPARCECPVLSAMFCSALSGPQAPFHAGRGPPPAVSQARSQLTETFWSQLSAETSPVRQIQIYSFHVNLYLAFCLSNAPSILRKRFRATLTFN